MNREEYIKLLLNELKDMAQTDKEQIRDFFEEMICDRMEQGETQEEILASIGDPVQAAEKLREEYETQSTESREAQVAPAESCVLGGIESESCAGGLKMIRVIADCVSVRTERTPERRANVLFHQKEGIEYIEESFKEGIYEVRHRIKRRIFPLLGHSFKKEIIVKIPEDFTGDMEIVTDNGSVAVEQGGVLGKVLVNTTNGKIRLSHIHAEALEAQTSNGNIHAQDLESSEIRLHTSNAKIQISRSKVSDTVMLRSSNGMIETFGLEGKNISIRTSNAPIRGTLKGNVQEYDIYSKTSNGPSSLPDDSKRGKDRKLDVKTSNAAIALAFEE